jgi:hypothetical protein
MEELNSAYANPDPEDFAHDKQPLSQGEKICETKRQMRQIN